LIEEGVAVNVNNKYNGMALYEATRNGHLAVAQVLLKMDADVNVRYSDNQMPLHWTTKYVYLDIIKELLVSGANLVQKQRWQNTIRCG
jgi:ankyrin repeat protein